jgi:hypothetical protein
MGGIKDIEDKESLEAWLKDQPRETALWIASRAAARVLPVWWNEVLTEDWARQGDLSALPILRCVVTSSVAATGLTVDMKRASDAAALAAASTAGHAADAASAAFLAAAGDANAPFATAAAARAAAAPFASSANFADAWAPVRSDCATLAADRSLAAAPLWPDRANPLQDRWDAVIARLRDDPPPGGPWDFWRDWYQGLLEGTPMDADLLTRIALIDPEDWDAGPERVNPMLAEMVAEHRRAKATELFNATLFDFTFDHLEGVMRAVPLPKDWQNLDDPESLAAFLEDAESLAESLELFCAALRAEGGEVQGGGAIVAYANAVLDELRRAESYKQLRVGKLVEYGRILEAASVREEVLRELGPVLSEPFRRNVNSLKQLVREHFAQSLARFAPLRDFRMEDGANPWEVLATFREIVAQVRSGADGALPVLHEDDAAVLEDVLDSIDLKIRGLQGASDPDTRESMKRDIDFEIAKIGATGGVYAERAKQAVGKAGEMADATLKWEKRGRGLWSFGREILERLGWNGA